MPEPAHIQCRLVVDEKPEPFYRLEFHREPEGASMLTLELGLVVFNQMMEYLNLVHVSAIEYLKRRTDGTD